MCSAASSSVDVCELASVRAQVTYHAGVDAALGELRKEDGVAAGVADHIYPARDYMYQDTGHCAGECAADLPPGGRGGVHGGRSAAASVLLAADIEGTAQSGARHAALSPGAMERSARVGQRGEKERCASIHNTYMPRFCCTFTTGVTTCHIAARLFAMTVARSKTLRRLDKRIRL